ncbi:MAG: FMN-binding protein [Clostridiales bacterium]|jgi:electron transport complex protein RnfG|nr:FMN-binding protein [Clostridiales bacterium]
MKNILKYAGILFAITLLVGSVLAVVNAQTQGIIARLSINEEEKSRDSVVGGMSDYTSSEKIGDNIWAYKKGDDVSAWAVLKTAKGYGGDIKVMVGIDRDLRIISQNILDQSETPGLGANCENDTFLRQFIGKTIDMQVKKSGPYNDNDIQAITGATITTKAVTGAANEAVEQVKVILDAEAEAEAAAKAKAEQEAAAAAEAENNAE